MPWEGMDGPGRSLLLTPASPPTGPHVRPPLLHPLPGQLLHHPPCRPPEDSEQEPGHEGELKWGTVEAWTVSPHWLHPLYPHLLNSVRTLVSHPIPWRPGCGTELGGCSWTVHVLTTGLDPCWSHSPGVRSTLHLLPCLPPTSKRQDALGQPLPSVPLGCSLDAGAPQPTGTGQRAGTASHPKAPPSPSIRREGVAGEGWEQQEPAPGTSIALGWQLLRLQM